MLSPVFSFSSSFELLSSLPSLPPIKLFSLPFINTDLEFCFLYFSKVFSPLFPLLLISCLCFFPFFLPDELSFPPPPDELSFPPPPDELSFPPPPDELPFPPPPDDCASSALVGNFLKR